MASETRHDRPQADDDGVRVIRSPGVSGAAWLLVAAIGLVAFLLLFVVRPLFRPAGDDRVAAPQVEPARDARLARQDSREHPAPAAERAEAARLPTAPVQIPAAAKTDAPEESGAAAAEDVAPEAAEAGASGDQPTGIALFPPPGTDPPKVGIVVPDGFELPPGYVRHYQVTDDGQALEPILMFHPDFKLLDEKGNAVAMPADRVVPADMAPPGLPIHMLEVPDTEAPLAESPEGQSGEEPAP
jgi:hypothetical protein